MFWIRRLPRFSLRTLMLAMLLAGAGTALWKNRFPWVRAAVLKASETRWDYVGFSGDGERVIAFHPQAGTQIWDATNGKVLTLRKSELADRWTPHFIERTRNGPLLIVPRVTSSEKFDSQTFDFFNLDHDGSMETFEFDRPVNVRVSPDGSRLIAFSRLKYEVWKLMPHRKMFEAERDPRKPAVNASFSPNGKWFSIAGETCIEIFDAESGAQLAGFVCDAPMNDSLAAPDGLTMLATSYSVTPSLWDVGTKEKRTDLEAARTIFSRDGSRLYSAPFSDLGHLIDTRGGAKISKIAGYNGLHCNSLFSNDGRLIVRDSNSFAVYDQRNGALLERVETARAETMLDPPLELAENDVDLVLQADELEVWHRHHPEWWWGVAWTVEFWVMSAFVAALVWSARRDDSDIKKSAKDEVRGAK